MMTSKLSSVTITGLNVTVIHVEVDIDRRSVIHDVDIVGLGDTAVKESKKRVKSALRNSGFSFPQGRVTVNLAPGDIRKEGSFLDLPIALGILQATGIMKRRDFMAMGELSLDGGIRKIRGVLPALSVLSEGDFSGTVVIPRDNIEEAQLIDGLKIYAFKTLREVVEYANGLKEFLPVEHRQIPLTEFSDSADFSEVKGQLAAKRALEIAASGGHNVLMRGSPGSGKTMLARRFPSILPPMTTQEALEVIKIYSAAGLFQTATAMRRPFRSPHHTASTAAIIGGGNDARPGEVTLSHNGVLFLDEFPEFRRDVIEALRQPLEDGVVTIARARMTVTYPANFTLIAAMNPCPCGNYGSPDAVCTCSPYEIARYNKKLSEPILDRIDMIVHVPKIKVEEYFTPAKSESSKNIRNRVVTARNRQIIRYDGTGITSNSQIPHKMLAKFVSLDEKSEELLKLAAKRYNLSGRAIDKILRLARTIADLDSSDSVCLKHVSEALQYRTSEVNTF
ncbi:MAG: YifB family Mg chelatase-like AAA ATPase [Thermotogaceae bacterium]|nr:YifB family Mg chelatase-like AAA ATPase [Thermotogaceae bacterium]